MYVKVKTYSKSSSSGTIKFSGGSMGRDKYCVEIKFRYEYHVNLWYWWIKKNNKMISESMPFQKHGNCRNAAKKFADDMGIRLVDKEVKDG